MPQIRGNSFAKIYSVVKMQQICKETKKMCVTHTFSKMSVQLLRTEIGMDKVVLI